MSPLWMALGTLTAVRVPAPAGVDHRVAGAAMALAPLAGLVVAAPAVAVLLLGDRASAPPLLVAAIAVAAVALGSRGLHLDGLADTADGLAASYDRDRALAVMRRGDTGPAGTATVVLVLIIQIAALSALVDRPWAVLVAVTAGRSVLSMACARGIPAARAEGLGATVAGSVPPVAAVAVAAIVAGGSAVLALAAGAAWWAGALAVAAAYAAAALLLRRCVRRLGGVTGDVLGACVEVAVAAALVALAVTPSAPR
jgi:adenosylcobinamide-GDP ribazoletransferase